MRSTLLLAIVVAGLLGLILWSSTSAQAPPPLGHPAWEYKVLTTSGLPQDVMLNQWGKDGWELVTVTVEQRGSNTTAASVFKRPKQ